MSRIFLCAALFWTLSDCANNHESEYHQKKTAGFLFSLPKTLVWGKNETVCLTLHETKVPAEITIELKWKEKAFQTVGNLETEYSCLDLYVPRQDVQEPQYASIHVQIVSAGETQSAHNQDPILVYPARTNRTFLDTDKAVYRPGDTVRFRVLVVDEDFMPQDSKVPDIKITNPLDVTVAVWDNVELRNGLATLEYTTVPEALTGKWKIQVGESTKQFEILKYTLPRFKLEVVYPRILYYKNSIKVHVCGRYSHGKALKGSAFIKVSDSHNNMVPINKITELKNGCHEFKFTNTELNIGNIKQKFPLYDPKVYIHIAVTITEQGTNRMDASYGRSLVVLKPYFLKFVTDQTFQPGLPYKGQIKLSHLNTDIRNDAVEICYNLAIKKSWNYMQHEQCSNFSVSNEGVVDFSLMPMKHNVIHIKMNVRSLNYTGLADSYLAVRLYSPSSSYIRIKEILNQTQNCDDPEQFIVYFTTDKFAVNENVTFYYMIRTYNEIYTLRKHVHTVKKKFVDFGGELQNVIGQKHKFVKTGNNIDKFTLKFKLEKRTVSRYHLLVYYVTKNGETVTSTIAVNVDPCREKVDAKWSQNQLSPGETATLNIKAKSNAICSISAVDKATKFMAKHQLTNLQTLIKTFSEERESAQSGRRTCVVPTKKPKFPSTYHRKSPDSIFNRSKRHVYSFSEDFDAYDIFEKFGSITVTNLKMVTKPCYTGPRNGNPAQYLSNQYEDDGDDQYISIRSQFPETWIWELVPVREEIQIQKHLPHSITSWATNVMCISKEKGILFADETEITSFQQFFAEVITPYSVKKGEEFHITVHVSNYLQYKFPIRLTLYLSQGLSLIDQHQKLKSSYCIQENNTFTKIFHMKGNSVGSVNITALAETDHQYPTDCGPETIVSRKDIVFKAVQIEPEGYPVKITKSAFLCTSNDLHSSNASWDISVPSNIVTGTAKAELSLNGDLLGKTLENLHELLTIPTGCGEQIMASVAPNLYVLKYLNATKGLTHSVRQKILKNLKMGYQRILNYIHKDGSFSAFGYHDPDGSMFLTTFVVRTLHDAKQFIYVDQRIISKSTEWIFENQLENGCFNTKLHVFQDMGGTSTENSTAALTAYVILSLKDSNIEIPETVETNAKYCIRSQHDSDKYTLAVSCYALFKMNWESEAVRLLRRLMGIANQKDNMLWWTKQDDRESPATDIEITSYVLLCLLHQNTTENLAHAHGVVRWLTTKLSNSGGFRSTQDTVVALDALSKYAKIVISKDLNLDIKIESAGQTYNQILRKEDRLKSRFVPIPLQNDKVIVNTTGEGCVLAQLTISYYLKDVPKGQAFKLALDVAPVSNIDLCSIKSVTPCVSFDGPDDQSNMAVMEVALPSGYEADRASLYRLLENDSNSKVKMFEEKDHQVNLYFNRLDRKEVCFTFNINENSIVDFRKDSLIKLYDYYRPELEILQFYKMGQNCSFNYTEELPQISDRPPENIVNNITEKYSENSTNKEFINKTLAVKNISKIESSSKVVEENQIRKRREVKTNETLAAIQSTMEFLNREREFSSQLLQDNARSTTESAKNDEINTEVEYIWRRSKRDLTKEKDSINVPNKEELDDSLKSLNSQFVNMDVEMEMPTGMEGAVPNFVMPTSNELKQIMSSHKEN